MRLRRVLQFWPVALFLTICVSGAVQLRTAYAQQDARTPDKHSAVVWSVPARPIVMLGPVPRGCTWDVRAAGVATEYGGAAEYMIELITPTDDGACCYHVPLARAYEARGTPALALGRTVELRAGESLSARAWLRGVEGAGYRIGLAATYDETCQP